MDGSEQTAKDPTLLQLQASEAALVGHPRVVFANPNPVIDSQTGYDHMLLQQLQAQQMAQRSLIDQQLIQLARQRESEMQAAALPSRNEVLELEQQLLRNLRGSVVPFEMNSSQIPRATLPGLQMQPVMPTTTVNPSYMQALAMFPPAVQTSGITQMTMPSQNLAFPYLASMDTKREAPTAPTLAGAVFPLASQESPRMRSAPVVDHVSYKQPDAADPNTTALQLLMLQRERNKKRKATGKFGVHHKPVKQKRTSSAVQRLEHRAPRFAVGSSFILATPEDSQCLSEYQCRLREQIEVFEAGSRDLGTVQGRNRPVERGQVGFRCRHCARIPGRKRGAAYYPSHLSGIYQAVQNVAANHFFKGVCEAIPEKDLKKLEALRQTNSRYAGTGKEYWARSAALQGIAENDELGYLLLLKDPAVADRESS